MKYQAIIFDLDGTLLDTIEDISAAINTALEKCGYPHRYDREGTKYLIGDGADALVRRALKEKGGDLQAFTELKGFYMPIYREHNCDKAKPFEGLVETLVSLEKEGVSLFVATNKPDALAQVVLEKKMPEVSFKSIVGVKEGDPVKPDPYSVDLIVDRFGLDKKKTLYVGDSHVDIETAGNAGLDVCLCLWGYDFYTDGLKARADYLANEPKDLASIVRG